MKREIIPGVDIWNYPGGEVGVRINSSYIPTQTKTFRIHNSEELMSLLMFLNCLDGSAHAFVDSVFIPYLPYARQDRVAYEGDPVATEVVAKLLANTSVKVIQTLDVHSPSYIAAFKNYGITLISHSPVRFINDFIFRLNLSHWQMTKEDIVLISPDKGATEKTKQYAQELGTTSIIQCAKVRDPDTGKLTGFTIDPEQSNVPKDTTKTVFMIVDDICDGGGTFNGIIDVVKKEYPGKFYALWTTHGIYSNKLDKLMENFNVVGSTNSFLHKQEHDRLITINL